MTLHADPNMSGPAGVIDYRLERQRVLAGLARGEFDRDQCCDAQRELLRNAEFCGRPSGEVCPVCEQVDLVLVTYVFGPRLPSHGRCVTTLAEMQRIRGRAGTFTGYEIEVCTGCRWNHLTRTYLLGKAAG